MAVPYPFKRIRIIGDQWTIFVVPPVHPKLGKGNWGRCQFADREIYISNRLGRKNFKLTLAHELIHACHDEINWDDRLVKKFTRSAVEKLVDRLAEALVPFLAPKLFEIARKRGGRDYSYLKGENNETKIRYSKNKNEHFLVVGYRGLNWFGFRLASTGT